MKIIKIYKLLILIILTGCSNSSNYTTYDAITFYEDHDYSTRRFEDISLNIHEVVSNIQNTNLHDYELYYLKYGKEYNDLSKTLSTFEEIKLDYLKSITIDNQLVNISISYGGYIAEAKITPETNEFYDVFYYQEPLIGIHFTSINKEINSLYFNMDEKIVGESNRCFLESIHKRNEVADHFFNEALSIFKKE